MRTVVGNLAYDLSEQDVIDYFSSVGPVKAVRIVLDKETGKPLNGTLKYQLSDPRTAAEFAPTWDTATNNWTVLPDIKVWYK